MDARAGMLARLFERSMGLGPGWRVEDVWFESPESGDEGLHTRVGGAPGAAVACPGCGARRGVYDARERTWRHLDIWQFRTVVHCRAPRADCPGHGPRTARAPWEVRPSSHLTALLEAQALVMAMPGATVRAISSRARESDSRVWAMLGRAVDEARGAPTTRARAAARPAGPEAGSRGAAVAEATRDMASPHPLGRADAMPGAARTVDRLRVTRLLTRAPDRARCAGAKGREERRRLPRGARHVWPKRPESLTERRAAKRASLAPEHLLAARACAMVGAVRAVCSCETGEGAAAGLDRAPSWITHPNVPEVKRAARSVGAEREGVLSWFSARAANGFLEGVNSVIQSLERASGGFRNVGHSTTMIFLRLGRLDFSARLASGCATH